MPVSRVTKVVKRDRERDREREIERWGGKERDRVSGTEGE